MKKYSLLPLLTCCIFLFGCPSDKSDPTPNENRETIANAIGLYAHPDFPLTLNCGEGFEKNKIKVTWRKPNSLNEATLFGLTTDNFQCQNNTRTVGSNFRMNAYQTGHFLEFDISKYKGVKAIKIYVTYKNPIGPNPSLIGLIDFSGKLVKSENVVNTVLDGKIFVEMIGDFENVRSIIIVNKAEATDFQSLTISSK